MPSKKTLVKTTKDKTPEIVKTKKTEELWIFYY